MSQLIQAPKVFRTSPDTDKINEFVKQAGVTLRAVVQENTELREQLHNLKQSSADAVRVEALVKIASDACVRGFLHPRQISEKVSQWKKEGHSPEHYEDFFRTQGRQPFTNSENTDTIKESSPKSGVSGTNYVAALDNLRQHLNK